MALIITTKNRAYIQYNISTFSDSAEKTKELKKVRDSQLVNAGLSTVGCGLVPPTANTVLRLEQTQIP